MKSSNRGARPKRSMFLRALTIAVAGLVLGLNAYYWNAGAVVGNKVPMPFGYGASVVLSGSMEPAYSVDDLVFIRQQKSYEAGDVVVYQDGSELIMHRIVSIDEEYAVTRGDANNASDEAFPVRYIKGRVFASIPGVGGAVRLLKNPAAAAATALAAIVLLEASFRRQKGDGEAQIEDIKAEIRRLKAEREASEGPKGPAA